MNTVNFFSHVVFFFFISVQSAYSQRLEIQKIHENFFVYTTYKTLGDYPFPSNSMYVITDSGAVLIDTPWDSSQVLQLIDSIRIKHNSGIWFCVATHSHADRTAGLGVLNRLGIKTISTEFTNILCLQNQEQAANTICPNDTIFNLGNTTMELFYPGRGHSPDNIVLWFPTEKILYGGCLLKSLENISIGNVADANIPEWEYSLMNVMDRYPDPRIVIPGHFKFGDGSLLQHTLGIVKSELAKMR